MSKKLILVDSSCPFRRRITAEFLLKNINSINETFNWLEDDVSRRTMIACFDGYISLVDFAMEAVRSLGEQYYDEELVTLCDGEVLVDCGAFIGDSIIPFVKLCKTYGVHYNKIFGFEPDKEAYARLQEVAATIKDCYVVPYGVSDSSRDMYINHDLGASTLLDSGNGESVPMRTIDEYLRNEAISFIKMDLEGGEIEAMHGAQDIIQSLHPKLAICIYHKPEDWTTIPRFIKSLNPNYKLYCRGYYNNLSEIVLYAVE